MAQVNPELVIQNGFRQFDFCLEFINDYLDPERPFALRPYVVRELQKRAVEGIETLAGQYRMGSVGIEKSAHAPPPAHLVEMHVIEMCEHINENWHLKNAFYLSSYAMWRLNWIHPFSDGNGRTSRALSYAVLCLKLGYVLPGSPTIPQQIELDRTRYFKALEAADRAALEGHIDLSEMEALMGDMLSRQLIGVVEQASGTSILDN